MRDPIPPTGLRKARLLKGWRLVDLADRVGLNAATIWRLETRGTGAPRPTTRRKLADALGVSESDLFG